MRVSGALFLTILIAAGFVLYLTARDTTSSLDAIATVATNLREEGVTGRALDREAALRCSRSRPGSARESSCDSEPRSDLEALARFLLSSRSLDRATILVGSFFSVGFRSCGCCRFHFFRPSVHLDTTAKDRAVLQGQDRLHEPPPPSRTDACPSGGL